MKKTFFIAGTILTIAAAMLIGCASFNTSIFNSSKLVSDTAVNATHIFNQYASQTEPTSTQEKVATIEKARTNLYDLDRKLSITLNEVEILRQQNASNSSATSQQVIIDTLASAQSQITNIVNVVKTITGQDPTILPAAIVNK